MKSVFATNPNNWTALIARLALALVIFPHGAQKLFGWFGGYGYEGTMGYLTTAGGLSYPVALLVILIESIGALLLFLGLATRIAALGVFGLFLGIIFKAHSQFGFFMNWTGQQKGEGIEYFVLLLGLALILMLTGGGAWSLDSLLTRGTVKSGKLHPNYSLGS